MPLFYLFGLNLKCLMAVNRNIKSWRASAGHFYRELDPVKNIIGSRSRKTYLEGAEARASKNPKKRDWISNTGNIIILFYKDFLCNKT